MVGIYSIQNLITGLRYIGSSIKISLRRNNHYSCLRSGTHPNKKLQEAFNTYGEHNLIFSIIEECSEDKLKELEEQYIHRFDSYNNGYNNTDRVLSSSMQSLSVRQKHWGTLHGNSKYSLDQLYLAFEMLATTSMVAEDIGSACKIDKQTIHYIVNGGHEWLWHEYPELGVLVSARVSKKSNIGYINSNDTIINVMKHLLDNPKDTFEEVSRATGVSKETVSAVSSGRQFSDLILNSSIKDRAKEYYTLGKLNYAKIYSKKYTVEDLKICNAAIEHILSRNIWLSRDRLHSEYKIPITLSRKLTEFDLVLVTELIDSKLPLIVDNILKLMALRKTSRALSNKLASTLNEVSMYIKNKNDDRR